MDRNQYKQGKAELTARKQAENARHKSAVLQLTEKIKLQHQEEFKQLEDEKKKNINLLVDEYRLLEEAYLANNLVDKNNNFLVEKDIVRISNKEVNDYVIHKILVDEKGDIYLHLMYDIINPKTKQPETKILEHYPYYPNQKNSFEKL